MYFFSVKNVLRKSHLSSICTKLFAMYSVCTDLYVQILCKVVLPYADSKPHVFPVLKLSSVTVFILLFTQPLTIHRQPRQHPPNLSITAVLVDPCVWSRR